jgi:hypothetical protein
MDPENLAKITTSLDPLFTADFHDGRRNIKITDIPAQKKRRAMAEVSHQEHAWRM